MTAEATNIASMLSYAAQCIASQLDLTPRIARLEARILAAQVLCVDAAWLLAHDTDRIAEHQFTAFNELLNRRLAGEPIAYITGQREFYSHRFYVTPDVLIPRPETELLVDCALAHIRPHHQVDVLELGCGSGCVAISIALARPDACITAIDCSAAALQVAKKNADHHSVDIEFVESDWFTKLAQRKFDIIVSNPPYIPSEDRHLGEGDVRFEPIDSLASGKTGLNALSRIIQQAPYYLRPRASLIIEHGYDQAHSVCALLNASAMVSVQTYYDLAGHPRVTSARMSE